MKNLYITELVSDAIKYPEYLRIAAIIYKKGFSVADFHKEFNASLKDPFMNKVFNSLRDLENNSVIGGHGWLLSNNEMKRLFYLSKNYNKN